MFFPHPTSAVAGKATSGAEGPDPKALTSLPDPLALATPVPAPLPLALLQ